LVEVDADSAVSRAYYAAFHAASADARKAVEFAEQILGAVAAAQPELENN